MEYSGLKHQPGNNAGGLIMKPVRRFLRAQFGRPTGLAGLLAGKIMARTPSNNARIEWTLSLLDIQPDDRILEIGFGPGVAVKRASQAASRGFIAGVDHSTAMLRQASRRNARAIREGSVDLRVGSASDIPHFGTPFDKIFTINSIHFWNAPVDCLRKQRDLLIPGGLIAVTVQPRTRGATDSTTAIIGAEMVANLKHAGFAQCRVEIRKMAPVAVACALGIK